MKSIFQVFSFDFLSKFLMGFSSLILIRYMAGAEYAIFTLSRSLIAVIIQTFASSFNRIYIVGYEGLNNQDSPSTFLGFQMLLLTVLVILIIPLNSYVSGIYWVIVATVFASCLSEFSKTFFQKKLQFVRFSMIEIARTVIFVLSLLSLIYIMRHNIKAWHVLSVQAIAFFAVFLIAFSKYIKLKDLFKITKATHLTFEIMKGESRYLFGYFFILAFFSQIDVFMLKSISNEVELATYGSAFRYYGLLSMALNTLHVVLLPAIQKIQSSIELKNIFDRLKKIMFLFALSVFIAAWASQWLIPLVDMGKYPDAVPTFRILAVSSIVSFAFSPHVNILMRFEDFRFLFFLISVAFILNIALNTIMIPSLGAIGAAITTTVTYAGVNYLIFLRSRKYRNSFALSPTHRFNK